MYGTTNNPWNTALTQAVHQEQQQRYRPDLPHSNSAGDLAGSIRIPAHYCGVYGHKPTMALFPCAGMCPAARNIKAAPMVVAGPMAQSANDLTTLFNVLC